MRQLDISRLISFRRAEKLILFVVFEPVLSCLFQLADLLFTATKVKLYQILSCQPKVAPRKLEKCI